MKEALKLALDALEYWDVHGKLHQPTEEAITALRLAIDVQNIASESTYKAALAQKQEPVDFTSLLREAEEIVQSKPTWKRFIDGTPLSNDIVVWMAVFAQDVARRNASQPAQQADHSEQHLEMVKAQQKPWCMKMNGCKTKCEDCPVEVVEQEPVAKYSDIVSDGGLDPRNKFDAPPQPEERNFCPRCGKRTADLTVIHTCTPPQRKPLTDDEIWKFWCSRPEVLEGEDDSMEAEFVTAVRAVLAAHNIKENT